MSDYIRKIEHELDEMEKSLLSQADDVVERFRARRQNVERRIEELKNTSADQWEIVRAGVESAWAELRAAHQTLKEDLQSKASRSKQNGQNGADRSAAPSSSSK